MFTDTPYHLVLPTLLARPLRVQLVLSLTPQARLLVLVSTFLSRSGGRA